LTLRGMIGMPVTNHHVWGHAYGHDILQNLGLCDEKNTWFF
jgi:hypothetical protein